MNKEISIPYQSGYMDCIQYKEMIQCDFNSHEANPNILTESEKTLQLTLFSAGLTLLLSIILVTIYFGKGDGCGDNE